MIITGGVYISVGALSHYRFIAYYFPITQMFYGNEKELNAKILKLTMTIKIIS